MAPSWILVPCLVTLRNEFNRLAPARDKASDGSVGDAAHSQSSSDHNPDETGRTPYSDADNINEVHAIDVDKDLRKAGWSMDKAVEIVVIRHRDGRDRRLQNVIYNRRIWSASWGWTARAYTGSNAHTQHAHFSARYTTAQESDTRPWGLLEADGDDDMATITQADFNARMDAWWNARMSPNAVDNQARAALRAAPWQQEVGRTGISAHNFLFGSMKSVLDRVDAQTARPAAVVDTQAVVQQLLAGLVAAGFTPEQIAVKVAELLPADEAQRFVDALAARLQPASL